METLTFRRYINEFKTVKIMANNDIYNDKSGLTFIDLRVTIEQARVFMNEVAKRPTHPEIEYVIEHKRTVLNIYNPYT